MVTLHAYDRVSQRAIGCLDDAPGKRILPAMTVPAFGCDYDEGYFDRDFQGKVSARVQVQQLDGGVVQIRLWGDRGGVDAYDRTLRARVVAYFKDLGLVKFDTESLYFDLEKNRLVSAQTNVVVARRNAPGDRFENARIEAAMALVLRLAAVLGQRGPPEKVHFPGWPPFEQHTGFDWSRLQFLLRCSRSLALCRKRTHHPPDPPPEAGFQDELRVELDYDGPHAGLLVSEGGTCTIEVRGPLELHPQAQAIAERFDWS